MTGPYEVKDYEENGRSQYREFESTLSPQCRQKADKLKLYLEARGPKLKLPHADHIEGPIWELRELCDTGALRIYYFQSGKTFYLTCGEVKKRKAPDQELIDYAKICCERHQAAQQN